LKAEKRPQNRTHQMEKSGPDLQKSEEGYRILLEQHPDAVCILVDGKFAYVNASAIRFYGVSGAEELLGHSALDLVPAESRTAFRRLADESNPSQTPLCIEHTLQRMDGREVEVETRALPFAYMGKRAVVSVVRDITERKRAEEALIKSNALLQRMFFSSHTLVAFMDPEFNFIRVNLKYAEADGRPPEYFVGRNHFELYPDPENEAIFRQVVETGEPYFVFEKPFVHPDRPEQGTTYWDWTLQPVKDLDGEVIGLVLSLVDRTERKRAILALQESEKSFRDLVENSPTSIFIIQDGRIVYRNPEHERLFVTLPKPFDTEGVHPEDLQKVERLYQELTEGKIKSAGTEFRYYPQEGMGDDYSIRWVYCKANAIEYAGKKAILVNLMDVTELKELEHMVSTQDKMRSLGRVAAGIAHETRNTLSGINISLDNLGRMLEGDIDTEKAGRIIEQLKSASNKIESIIRRVMDFSKPGEPNFKITDLNRPVEESLSLCSVTLRKIGVKLVKELADELPPCQADPQMLSQVILNLINNAVDAMKNQDAPKRIEVKTVAKGDRVLVSVSDSGPGVPLRLRKKIFDPFYTTKDNSTGIGLSVCHRIVHDHGGALRVSTSRWGGAEFQVELPIDPSSEIK